MGYTVWLLPLIALLIAIGTGAAGLMKGKGWHVPEESLIVMLCIAAVMVIQDAIYEKMNAEEALLTAIASVLLSAIVLLAAIGIEKLVRKKLPKKTETITRKKHGRTVRIEKKENKR